MIRCLHCGAETSNGLALCELCRRGASTYLEYLAVYGGNLARWRPGRAGSRPVPGSRVLYDGTFVGDGTGDRISDALDETATALLTWARTLVDDRPHLPRPLTLTDAVLAADLSDDMADQLNDDIGETMRLLCLAFEEHLTSISTLGWCGEFVHDLAHHEGHLRALTERYVPGWYAGGCRQVVGFDEEGAAVRCGSGTYVVPGLTWVTCHACGATTYARDHLETVLDEARGWVAPPMRLAEALVALVDTEISVPRLYERIKKWGQREQVDTLRRVDSDGDEIGPKRHRLGEVLDRLAAEGQTRLRGDVGRDAAEAS